MISWNSHSSDPDYKLYSGKTLRFVDLFVKVANTVLTNDILSFQI